MHHADDLEVFTELPPFAPLEHKAERLPLPLRYRRKPDIHDVHPDVGEHSREVVLVLRSDRDTWHLLTVAERVVVDADLVGRRKRQVVRETLGIAGELFERFLKLDRPYFIHALPRCAASLPAACAPTAPGRPCAAARS